MSAVPDYEDVVALYIRMIKADSPTAAAAIEQIREVCNAHAALRATVAMTLLKMDVQQHQPIPDVSSYAYMLVDYPEALPLLALAMECWLKDRRLRNVALGLQQDGDVSDADIEASLSAPDLPPKPED